MSSNGHATTFHLHHDAWGRLVLTDAHGREHFGAVPTCTFPITDPRHGISLCAGDGTEIIWIDALDDVAANVRSILEDELAIRHFLPVITHILKIEGDAEPTRWRVETDRGATEFSLKSEEDVRRIAGPRVVIADAHGIRYLIRDLNVLDAVSRRWLERYI